MSVSIRRSCYQKQRHKSLGAAEAHIRGLERAGVDTTHIHAYPCINPRCAGWHVGHKPRRDQKGRR